MYLSADGHFSCLLKYNIIVYVKNPMDTVKNYLKNKLINVQEYISIHKYICLSYIIPTN